MDNPRPRMLERAHFLPVLEKMKSLFDDCSKLRGEHKHVCQKESNKAAKPIRINLIDCRARNIIRASTSTPYAALSYVCGDLKPVQIGKNHELGYRSIEGKLATVYEDAIDIALFLGIEYLWIDQYCIEQKMGALKRRQLGQMGKIYNNASITIVAAVFRADQAGLIPPTEPHDWLNKWDSKDEDDQDEDGNNKELPEVLDTIKSSVWHTRAWTFQESYLSMRTLVVHPRGMYFECGTASSKAVEATEISEPIEATDLYFTKTCLKGGPSVRGYLDHPYAQALSWFTFLVEVYSSRGLTYQSDAINAFIAVLKLYDGRVASPVKYETTNDAILDMKYDEDSRYKLCLVQGLPFFVPVPKYKEGPDTFVRVKASALCWQHAHGQPISTTSPTTAAKVIERRSEFPSWSWVGWSGVVCWTLPENDQDYTSNSKMFFCFRKLHFRSSPLNHHSSSNDRAIKSSYSLTEVKRLGLPRLFFETIFLEANAFQMVKGDPSESDGKRSPTIKLMGYTLPWFDKPGTLYHSQGSCLDAETLYEDIRSEKCRIALIYAHKTHRASCFELQAWILHKYVDKEEEAAENCWYERVGGIYHQISMQSGSREREEAEQFLAWLKDLFKEPEYELIEIR